MNDRIKKVIILGITMVMLLTTVTVPAKIDLTGIQTGTVGGCFSGKYIDLDFAGTTGFSDLVDNISGGGFTYSNWFNQTLNTTDNPTFAGLTLDSNLNMNHHNINNAFEIECENDISVGNDIQLNDKLEHKDDTDTHLDFNINQIILVVGGVNVLDMLSLSATFGVNVTMNENLTVVGNANVTGNITASKFNTLSGTGWTGWIDDGTNVNCTYSGGILIAVSVTSGSVGYNETG